MNNDALLRRSLAAVWHPCTQMKLHERLPLTPIRRAEGVWLEDFDGRRYLDAISSWWVNLFGHSHPRIMAALRDQLDTLDHVMLAGFTHEPVVALSEQLSALTGGALGHCFYASDGASAVEIALKMSAHFWRNSGRPEKHRFLSLAGSYHGETAGALAVTDIPLFRDAYAPLLRPGGVVPSPDSRLAAPGGNAIDMALTAARALERHLAEHHESIAALIVEPLVQCAAGMAMHDPEYLRRARALCDRYGVHLIADEIAVGCGRTGTFFAHEQAGITPDFLCLSKGLTGGVLPLSVTLTTDAVYAAFYDDSTARGFLHSHSYTGNPLACRAALATLALFETEDALAANQRLAARITAAAAPLAADPRLAHFRRAGMIWAFDARSDDPLFARRFHRAAMDRGLLLRPIGNTVYFMPPYILDDSQIELLIGGTRAALDATLG
ncbi:MAG: adenosylmethionine--8-amino-7-oxononanoate transaminase [Zoogloeaceae bacterium]|jgi:adenosylmethionine-8-amino-7-oxononanoate aminotransferase|nr:adenosylmethionine--8-amino-7-oxononanoate transaminase [Zoogloeaceae bacterium]